MYKPITIKILPPNMDDFPASLVPKVFPIATPKAQITQVIKPITIAQTSASSALYSDMVNPTESASMEVATPCTNSIMKVVFCREHSSPSQRIPSYSIFPPI